MIIQDFQAFDFHRISFAVEAPPVFQLSHMGDPVASDIVVFIETCVFYEGKLDRFLRTISENHFVFIVIQVWHWSCFHHNYGRSCCLRHRRFHWNMRVLRGQAWPILANHFWESLRFHRDSSLTLKLLSPYGTAYRQGGLGSGKSANEIQKCCEKTAPRSAAENVGQEAIIQWKDLAFP